MKSKKKILLVIFTLILLAMTSVTIYYFNARDNKNLNDKHTQITEKDSKTEESNDDLKNDDVVESDKTDSKTDNNKESVEKDSQSTTTNEKKNETSTSNSTSKENNNNKTTTNSSSNNNAKENNSSTSKQETPKQETPKQETPQPPAQTTPPAKTCTPKKFDMSFVRPDFTSFAACTAMGDKYKAAGWGYFCDNYQDDCGDTYYMLTIYERNTGIEHDFHNVTIP